MLLSIALCACFTFVVPASSPSVRLAADLVLLLALVAFQQWLALSLKRSAYMTLLDRLQRWSRRVGRECGAGTASEATLCAAIMNACKHRGAAGSRRARAGTKRAVMSRQRVYCPQNG